MEEEDFQLELEGQVVSGWAKTVQEDGFFNTKKPSLAKGSESELEAVIWPGLTSDGTVEAKCIAGVWMQGSKAEIKLQEEYVKALTAQALG